MPHSDLLRKYPFGDENKEACLGSVIPAKAGIQANSAQQTWIPACAGMTNREERHGEENPSIFIFSDERTLMAHFVVKCLFIIRCAYAAPRAICSRARVTSTRTIARR